MHYVPQSKWNKSPKVKPRIITNNNGACSSSTQREKAAHYSVYFGK